LGTEPPTVAQSAASAISNATSHPAIDAERRQLTVMFCDLVGSTALSTRFDPEDLRELIGAYHRAVAETVNRFDGFVAKYMGDGVLIYFGYPQAHEDDAERAVRAGLAVIEAVGRLPVRQDLRVRLGIATGLAVVGDLIGEGAAQERGVVGETPNLAGRLQALATPGTLVIGEATRRQVGGLFHLADLGPQALAGFTEAQPCPARRRSAPPALRRSSHVASGGLEARFPRRGRRAVSCPSARPRSGLASRSRQ
jgi:class 3 adenylate cyclase